MLRISGVGASHVGLVRGHNEDSGFVGPALILVADGVGGAAAGEVASATTAYVVAATALARPEEAPASVLEAGVAQARTQLEIGVAQDSRRTGMATTLTALLTDGADFAMAHLGDSRGYVFRDGDLVRITRDHTVVQAMVEAGSLAEVDVAVHPWRNLVTRSVCVGGADADISPLALVPGDRVLLASDGLTDLVSEQWIAELLGRHGDDAAVPALVDAALSRGGRDNITCVVATIIEGPPLARDGTLLGAVRDVGNVIDAAAVRRHASA